MLKTCVFVFRVKTVEAVGGGQYELYLQVKPAVDSLFPHTYQSAPFPPPSVDQVKFNEDFVVKVSQPVRSFHLELNVKEKHTLMDKVIAHGTLQVPDKIEFGKVVADSLSLKSSNGRSSAVHFEYIFLHQLFPPQKIKELAYYCTKPLICLESGKSYYPGDVVRGFVAFDNASLSSFSNPATSIFFTVSSHGTTFDTVPLPGLLGGTTYATRCDYRHYEVNRVANDFFSLFPENTDLKLVGGVHVVPFSFEIPKETPMSLPDAKRLPYFSEKVGRSVGEDLNSIAVHWDKLPIAHTAISLELVDAKHNNHTITQPLEILYPPTLWLDSLPSLTESSSILLDSIQDKIMPSSPNDAREFITLDVVVPEFVYINEKFKVQVKFQSKLCKKLCNVEVRVGTSAEFDAKMVSIQKYYTGIEHRVEDGKSLRTTNMATVYRATIPDFSVSEGECKEAAVDVLLDESCLPTLLNSMYPLIHSWNWVEISVQKGDDKDDTYSLGQKYYLVSRPIVVLPARCNKPVPSATPGAELVDPPSRSGSLLNNVKVDPLTCVDELPFLLPTTDGGAYTTP